MRIGLPTLRDRSSLEPITSIPTKKSKNTSGHRLLIEKRMKSELVWMRLRVEVEKNFMQ
jgi:hypothetical protein